MTLPPPPPNPATALRGTKFRIGRFVSTVLPDIDFETYSEAGYQWGEKVVRGKLVPKWLPPVGSTKDEGIFAVGAAVYTEHPSAEVLSCAYNLKDGSGPKMWVPGMPLPLDLFEYLLTYDPWAEPSYDQPGIIEAHHSMFEVRVCLAILAKRYGWPQLEIGQFRCSMAKARAHALPGGLAPLGTVLGIEHGKDSEGTRLLNKFSVPQDPTSKNGMVTRVRLADDPDDAQALYRYNARDIVAESEASALIPDLPPFELRYWLADQRINYRGVHCDRKAVEDCIVILEQALAKYNPELEAITGGLVPEASKVAALKNWLEAEHGIKSPNLDDDAITEILARDDIPDDARRALDIRQLIGSASVKKVYAMIRQVTEGDRLCDMAIYHGARTGRDNGDGVQPLNMPKAGPALTWCISTRKPYRQNATSCPHCGLIACSALGEKTTWHPDAVDFALEIMASRSLELVEFYFGSALLAISGCVRGLFTARPGYELLGVDYASIEAVVAACLAGEQWRIDTFRNKRDIYLESAAKVLGKTYDWYMANGGKKHPDRAAIGKFAELALGFSGWVNGWYGFDKSGRFTEDQLKDIIMAWREASPRIVEMWGGQVRGKPWAPDYQEYYGLEGMAILALLNPGQEYSYNGITYFYECDRLYCRLLSGRHITYHQPRLSPSDRWGGQYSINFMGWNTNPKKGPLGWVWMNLYGGLLFENVVQATARDIMAHGVLNCEARDMPVVLRVHDEVVPECPIGAKTIADVEAALCDLPEWCKDWPIRAEGWKTPRRRYQKD
jgi:DNA polymerase